MTTYLTVQELQALPRNERMAYCNSLHNETMNNLNRINRIADDEIKLINQITNKLANATSDEIPKLAPAFCTGNNRYSCECDYCK